MDVFDSNKDGTINYSEFLFMFVDRQAILRRWDEKTSPTASAGPTKGMSMQGCMDACGAWRVLFQLWRVIPGSGVFSKELESARLRSAMLSADIGGTKGNGQVARKAAEATLLRSGLFETKVGFLPLTSVPVRGADFEAGLRFQEFPMSAILDHFEAAVKAATGLAGLVPVDDVIAYVSDPRPEIDSLKFGESVFPIAKRGSSTSSTPGRSPGRPNFRIKIPKEFAGLSKK